MNAKECCVLIPSLSPDEKLPAYVQELLKGGFGGIVVVDDGSKENYQEIFSRIAAWDRCFVLHHPQNKGKGAALKTGFQYIRKNTSFQGIITADSDGQHTVKDTLVLAEKLKDEQVLWLGSRDFSKGSKQVPPKSRFGNRMTSVVFKALYGPSLPDTQTGLRAFPSSMIPFMLDIKGDRFEYEMNMLITCALRHIPMNIQAIETVYLEENKGTHFHPIRDSWRIYKLLFGNFFKFASSGVLATVVDFLLFFLLSTYVMPLILGDAFISVFGMAVSGAALLSTIGARAVSAVVNFKVNQNFVFSIQKSKGAWLRYIILCVGVVLVSGITVGALKAAFPRINSVIFKMPVDFILFMMNYRIQQNWVFSNKKKEEKN